MPSLIVGSTMAKGDRRDTSGRRLAPNDVPRGAHLFALAGADGPGNLDRGSVRAGLPRSDERQLPADAPRAGAQPRGQRAAAALRLVGQLREGAHRAGHRHRRLRPGILRIAAAALSAYRCARLVHDQSGTRRGDRFAQFLATGSLFHPGIARPGARLRANVRGRRRQGRRGALSRPPVAHELSAEYRLRRPRQVAAAAAAARLRGSRALGIALPHRRFRRRNDPRHDYGLAVETVRHPRRDLGLPMISLVNRLIERLALAFALEATQPNIDGWVGLAAEGAADDHALGDLERDDLLFHDLDPFIDLAGPNLVLAQFVKGHLALLPRTASFRGAS